MKKGLFLLIIFTGFVKLGLAAAVSINHFIVKANPFAKNEIAIVATDTAGNVNESISGTFTFTINGFDHELSFDRGTAFYHHKLLKSSFLYVKHENEAGTHSILYYVYKSGDDLHPIHISWMLLLIIPVILIVLGYMFKRFIILAIIIFIIFLYFNHHNGLSIPTFFESIIDGLKSLFNKG